MQIIVNKDLLLARRDGILKRAREIVLNALENAILAVDSYSSTKRSIRLEKEILILNSSWNPSKGELHVVGAGKAGAKMALAVEDSLGDIVKSGAVNVLRGTEKAVSTSRIELIPAGHPLPDLGSIEGTKKILNIAEKLKEEDLLLVLISGGGSAIMELPQEGISLDDLIKMNRLLISCGADIKEINTVRKHVSRVKGGRLAKATKARVISLIISDVIGDPLDSIASGPTAPDSTTFRDAMDVIEKYDLEDKMPASIMDVLRKGIRGEIEETPKPGDDIFNRVDNYIIANNRIAVRSMAQYIEKIGIKTVDLGSRIRGEARDSGSVIASIAKSVEYGESTVSKPVAIIGGGETTVTLRGKGRGGRNQEFVLSTLREISNCSCCIASIGTDGIDGNSDAAGAIADGKSLEESLRMGMNPDFYLKENNSYEFFSRLGDLIFTGPTLTNVMDIFIALII